MISDNLRKTALSILLGFVLFWVVTGTAATITGDSTTTYTYSDGGGGGGASGEKYENIEVKEKYDLFIYKDKVTSYAFTTSSNPVMFVNITGNVNAGEIRTAVEVLRNTSTLVKTPAPGIVYKNINIWVGTYGFAVPKNIKEAVIRFRVENSWIRKNNLAASDVMMVRWTGSSWEQLETSETAKDGDYTYFEAKTDSFSPFAITASKRAQVPAPMLQVHKSTGTAGSKKETRVSVPSQKEKAAGFELIPAIAVLCAVYLFWRKRR